MVAIYFSQFWSLRSPGSWLQKILCLEKDHFLDVCLCPVTSHDGRDKGAPRGLFHKGTSLIQEDSPS